MQSSSETGLPERADPGAPALGDRAGDLVQYDFGDSPVVDEAKTALFCA